MRRITATIIGLLIAPATFAANIHVPEPALPTPLTLQDAIDIGLRYQTTVGVAAYEAIAAHAGITVASSGYYPQVTPSFEFAKTRTTGPGVTIPGGNGVPTQTFNGTTDTTTQVSQLNLQQLILDNGTRDESAAASRNQARAQDYNLEDTRQSVILTIATDYYDLLQSKELAKVAQANVDSTKTTLDATTAEVQAGTVASNQVLQATANYQNAVVQLITANNNVHIAEATLKNEMGIFGDQVIVTPDGQLPAPSSTPDTKTADDYLKTAIANRPDVQEASNLIDAERHDEHVANLASSLQVQANATDTLQSQPNNTTDAVVGVDLSYPLFDGGSARAKVRQAEAALEETRLQASLTVENAQESVTQAYLQREADRQATVAAQVALTAAQSNLAAAQDSQKEGVDTIIDVITAQTALVTAETNNVQAVYNYYIADAQLQRAIGANDPTPAHVLR